MAKGTSNNKANGGGKWIRSEKRASIYRRDGYRCVYCGEHIADPEVGTLTLDHVLAQELGGTNDAGNLVTACLACNSGKGKKTTAQFFAYLRGRGVDTAEVARRIRNATRRTIKR
jgi:5-methylcytosine-specific restriction endonuclease McrA